MRMFGDVGECVSGTRAYVCVCSHVYVCMCVCVRSRPHLAWGRGEGAVTRLRRRKGPARGGRSWNGSRWVFSTLAVVRAVMRNI